MVTRQRCKKNILLLPMLIPQYSNGNMKYIENLPIGGKLIDYWRILSSISISAQPQANKSRSLNFLLIEDPFKSLYTRKDNISRYRMEQRRTMVTKKVTDKDLFNDFISENCDGMKSKLHRLIKNLTEIT